MTSELQKTIKTPAGKAGGQGGYDMQILPVAQNLGNDTREFLARLWGDGEGWRFISGKVPGGSWSDSPVKNIDEALIEIERRITGDVYASCATFGDVAGRKASNARELRSFYLDLDCGEAKAATGKGYISKKEAFSRVSEFCLVVGLPAPSIVDSGNGIHGYWLLDRALPVELWKATAEKLKALTHQHGLLADNSVTADSARVLRVPGTFNFKDAANPKRVTIKRLTEATHTEKIVDAIETAHGAIAQGKTPAVPSFLAGERGNLSGIIAPETPEAVARLQSALNTIPPGSDRTTWRDCVWSVLAHGWPCCVGIARDWSARCPEKFDCGDFQTVVDSFNPAGGIGAGSLYHSAKQHGWVEAAPKTVSTNAGWPELQPLPPKYASPPRLDSNSLPTTLASYVADSASRMQIPGEMVSTPLLISLGSVFGKKVAVQPKANDSTWFEFPSFWGACIAPPGFLKSPSIAAGMRHIQELDDGALRQHDLHMMGWQSEERVRKLEIEQKHGEAKREVKNGNRIAAKLLLDGIEDIKPPTRPRYIVQDCTPEARLDILGENPNGCLQLSDELDGHIAQLRKDGFEAARAQELQFHDGKADYATDRIKRGSSVAEGPRLSVYGGLQPAKIETYLRALKNGGADDGYIQRLLQLGIQPTFSADYTLTDVEPDQEADAQVRAIFQAANEMPLMRCGQTGRVQPRILKFSAEAQAQFDGFLVSLENRIRSGSIGGDMLASHAGKYRGTLPKLALLVALAENPAAVVINKTAFSRAYALLKFYLSHAKRIYAVEARGDIVSAHELLTRIKTGHVSDGFSPRDDVMRREWPGLTKAGETEGAISVLVAHGYLREVFTETAGRPRRLLLIHPDVLPDKTDRSRKVGGSPQPRLTLLSGAQ